MKFITIKVDLMFLVLSMILLQSCYKMPQQPTAADFGLTCGAKGSGTVCFKSEMRILSISWANSGSTPENVGLSASSPEIADQIVGGCMTYGFVPAPVNKVGNDSNCFESEHGVSTCTGDQPRQDYKTSALNSKPYTIAVSAIIDGGASSASITCSF